MQIDKTAEQLVLKYMNYLVSPTAMYLQRMPASHEKAEGRDIKGFALNGNGNTEVKAFHNFLTHGGDNYEPSGSIPFEVFLKNKRELKAGEKNFPGWLFNLLDHPSYKDYSEIEGRTATAAECGKLVFVPMDSEHKPFACIMFENTRQLVKCLAGILPLHEWSIGDPENLYPYENKKYWDRHKRFDKEHGGMMDNCWYVPFRQISHLATVTMINNDPEIKETYTNQYGQEITRELQEGRLNYLKQCAEERRIYPDKIDHEDPGHRFIDFSAVREGKPEELKMTHI